MFWVEMFRFSGSLLTVRTLELLEEKNLGKVLLYFLWYEFFLGK